MRADFRVAAPAALVTARTMFGNGGSRYDRATPAGKAAIKSVKAVADERAQGRVASNDTAKDWLT